MVRKNQKFVTFVPKSHNCIPKNFRWILRIKGSTDRLFPFKVFQKRFIPAFSLYCNTERPKELKAGAVFKIAYGENAGILWKLLTFPDEPCLWPCQLKSLPRRCDSCSLRSYNWFWEKKLTNSVFRPFPLLCQFWLRQPRQLSFKFSAIFPQVWSNYSVNLNWTYLVFAKVFKLCGMAKSVSDASQKIFVKVQEKLFKHFFFAQNVPLDTQKSVLIVSAKNFFAQSPTKISRKSPLKIDFKKTNLYLNFCFLSYEQASSHPIIPLFLQFSARSFLNDF